MANCYHRFVFLLIFYLSDESIIGFMTTGFSLFLNILHCQEGASDEDISQLPRYKFRRIVDVEKICGEISGPFGGVMTDCSSEAPTEHVLSEEDSVSLLFEIFYCSHVNNVHHDHPMSKVQLRHLESCIVYFFGALLCFLALYSCQVLPYQESLVQLNPFALIEIRSPWPDFVGIQLSLKFCIAENNSDISCSSPF